MRLDTLGMKKIRFLEREYGQLSNVPDDHPAIKRLTKYGKEQRNIRLTMGIYFYLTKEELDFTTEYSREVSKLRTPTIRSWVTDYLKKPYKLRLNTDIPKTSRVSFKIREEDYKKLMAMEKEYSLPINDLLAIIVKDKINSFNWGCLRETNN